MDVFNKLSSKLRTARKKISDDAKNKERAFKKIRVEPAKKPKRKKLDVLGAVSISKSNLPKKKERDRGYF